MVSYCAWGSCIVLFSGIEVRIFFRKHIMDKGLYFNIGTGFLFTQNVIMSKQEIGRN